MRSGHGRVGGMHRASARHILFTIPTPNVCILAELVEIDHGRQQLRSYIMLVSTAASMMLSCLASHAKNWDFDRGLYRTDIEVMNLLGPARRTTDKTFKDGKLIKELMTFYGSDGNIVKDEYYDYASNYCHHNFYTHDGRGNLINWAPKHGQATRGTSTCENLVSDPGWNYAYEFDARGAVVVRRVGYVAIGAVDEVWKYAYDPMGRLVAINVEGRLEQRTESYAYASDQRGFRVERHHTSRFNDGQLTWDAVRDITYSGDGRFLEAKQMPPGVAADFKGNETRTYSIAGLLLEQKYLDFGKAITYSKHDRYGNWTESVDSRGERVVRQIEY